MDHRRSDVGDIFTLDLTVTVDEADVFTNEAEVTDANEEDSDSVPNDGEGDDWDDETVEASEVLASGTIGDFVWYDDDRDGLQDADEAGVTGVTIRLTNNATSAVSTTVTNADGLYLVLSAGSRHLHGADHHVYGTRDDGPHDDGLA